VPDLRRAPILCFYGPPGIGKTSFAEAVGAAIGLKTIRIPLCGVRDEAVLRGHRRTYIGAMPGKVIQAVRDAQSSNLVIIFDEIGSMGQDFRGSLEDVLLEILSEQNKTFQDHYLDLEEGFDLSQVVFMATTNTLDLKEPLLDRLEIIELSGYTQEEKQKIATDYILPKLLKDHGMNAQQFAIENEYIDKVIQEYTYESGVRGLEQSLAKLVRKLMCYLEENRSVEKIAIDDVVIKKFLGHSIYVQETGVASPQIGVATGLAYIKKREGQEGEVLYIEAKLVPGDGKVECTGRLGEVMKESTQVAFKYLLANAEKYEIDLQFINQKNLHIHLPAGATPKDGPSAGVAIFCAMLSAIKNIPIRNDIAITGEISLYKVLPVGGIKEKVLAAYRRILKINTVFIPHDNLNDLDDVPKYVLEAMEIVPVKHVDEVLDRVFVK
jgi:ATP-dependent Lon protease